MIQEIFPFGKDPEISFTKNHETPEKCEQQRDYIQKLIIRVFRI